MLLLEIILTVFAWRNGYKWYSLIPMGFTFIIGFLSGIALALHGYTEAPLGFIGLDILTLAVLTFMCFVKPKSEIKTETKTETKTEVKTEVETETEKEKES